MAKIKVPRDHPSTPENNSSRANVESSKKRRRSLVSSNAIRHHLRRSHGFIRSTRKVEKHGKKRHTKERSKKLRNKWNNMVDLAREQNDPYPSGIFGVNAMSKKEYTWNFRQQYTVMPLDNGSSRNNSLKRNNRGYAEKVSAHCSNYATLPSILIRDRSPLEPKRKKKKKDKASATIVNETIIIDDDSVDVLEGVSPDLEPCGDSDAIQPASATAHLMDGASSSVLQEVAAQEHLSDINDINPSASDDIVVICQKKNISPSVSTTSDNAAARNSPMSTVRFSDINNSVLILEEVQHVKPPNKHQAIEPLQKQDLVVLCHKRNVANTSPVKAPSSPIINALAAESKRRAFTNHRKETAATQSKMFEGIETWLSRSLANGQQSSAMNPGNLFGSNYSTPPRVQNRGLRPIIIDGSNVAMGHGRPGTFSSRGLQICVDFFLKKHHKVYAFVPLHRRRDPDTMDSHILDKLEKSQHLIFTPSRVINGRRVTPYDDRYIVQTAAELGGVIVSKDNYRDLLQENPNYADVINNRLLMFTWIEDMIMFPPDPLGQYGPSLDAFLRF